MADALDSKSSYRKIVWVQVPPPVLESKKSRDLGSRLFFWLLRSAGSRARPALNGSEPGRPYGYGHGAK
jgi:hypothetical protein